MFSELFALHRRLAFFSCAACLLAALGFVATDECKTSIQLCRKIFILGGNMSRLARFAAKPRIQFLLCLATIPIFGRITKLDCVSHWPLPVSNWSDVTLAEALGCLFYAIVLPSPRLAPRESGSSTTARRFQTKASAATI